MNPMDIRGIFLLALVGIFSASLSGAFSITAPGIIITGENVTVIINAQDKKLSDVKILIIEKNELISQVYSSGWKSSFYYLPHAFPGKKEFILRSLTPASNASLCARLRPTGTQKYEEYCQQIVVLTRREPFVETEELSREQEGSSVYSSPIVLAPAQSSVVHTREYWVQKSIIVTTCITAFAILMAFIYIFIKRRI